MVLGLVTNSWTVGAVALIVSAAVTDQIMVVVMMLVMAVVVLLVVGVGSTSIRRSSSSSDSTAACSTGSDREHSTMRNVRAWQTQKISKEVGAGRITSCLQDIGRNVMFYDLDERVNAVFARACTNHVQQQQQQEYQKN